MTRRPQRSTRTDTLFPYTTLFRSQPLIAQVGSHNLAVGIDQVVLWYAAYAILHGNRVAPPFEVRYVYPRQTVLFDGLQPSLAAAFAIERYTEHFQPFIFVSFVGLYQVGVFRPAGGAPAGPEVDQHSSEERRVGKECVSTYSSRWSPKH